ncbi:MAG TPA: rod shape-determining protein [Firmicutes bacterium]|jgi:rod shape-determining protein MreB|nr:rod shape-determining protein [Bacillota bacterium]
MLKRFLTKDLGLDLGTANSLVYEKDKGIIFREPSVVAIQKENNQIVAVGEEALHMIGRTPGNIFALRPLREGVIANYELTKELIRHLLKKALKRRFGLKPRVVVSIPTGITGVERRAVLDATLGAGAGEAFLIEEPVAAAIGAGLPVQEAIGNMVINIGGGTTDVAVISLGGVVAGLSIRVGGDAMDNSIIRFIRRQYNLLIGERSAEELKIRLGTAYPFADEEEQKEEARGRDQVSGLPKNVAVTAAEIREALKEPVAMIINAIRQVVEKTPPELVADIINQEIIMTGGGALLKGIDRLVAQELSMKVRLAEDPMACVVKGAGMTLEHLDTLKRALVGRKKSTR